MANGRDCILKSPTKGFRKVFILRRMQYQMRLILPSKYSIVIALACLYVSDTLPAPKGTLPFKPSSLLSRQFLP